MFRSKIANLSALVASLAIAGQSYGDPFIQYGFDYTSGTVQDHGSVINDANPGTFNSGSIRRGNGGTYTSDIPTNTQFTTGIGSLDTSTGAFRTGTGATSGEGVVSYSDIVGAGGLTMEAWAKGGNNGLILSIAGAYNIAGAANGYRVFNGFRELTDFVAVEMDRSEWTHLALVMANPFFNDADDLVADLMFYVNGVHVGTFEASNFPKLNDLTRGLAVGDHPLSIVTTVSFHGLIYEPRISLGALTPDQFTIVIPEPASLALIGLGAGLLLTRQRVSNN